MRSDADDDCSIGRTRLRRSTLRDVLALVAVASALTWVPPSANAGCAAEPPELLLGTGTIPPNGVLVLVLSHPLWHSRRAANGDGASKRTLGEDVADLPIVLASSDGGTVPLRILSRQEFPGGRVAVALAPAAGWIPGATYRLRADVGTPHEWAPITVATVPDVRAPVWTAGPAMARIIAPPAIKPPRARTTRRCRSTDGPGSSQTMICRTEGTIEIQSKCPPPLTDPYVRLHLPSVVDDGGGPVLLEVRSGAATTWVAAAAHVELGHFSSCSPPNFPATSPRPYTLSITPLDSALNRGAAREVTVRETPSLRTKGRGLSHHD
jgi:hypothetical protein